MNALLSQGVFDGLSILAIASALLVLLSRDVMRMALALGAFMLTLAGFFAYYSFGLLALAELFLYVGGVLVLILFAIMLVHRASGGAPVLENRADPLMVLAAAVVSVMLFMLLRPITGLIQPIAAGQAPAKIAAMLLGLLLPQFEAVGALLLAALVGGVVVMGGDRR